MVGGIIAGILATSLVVGSMYAAPVVIRQLYRLSNTRAMEQERSVQLERLKHHIDRMSTLERALDEHRVRVEKLVLVYGLDVEGPGQGGAFPTGPVEAGETPELSEAERKEAELRRALQLLESQLSILSSFENQNADLVRHTPSVLPLPADDFVLTSPFGSRTSPFTKEPDFHKGLDLAAATGTPVLATADGVVTFAGRYPLRQSPSWWRFGNVVVVNHADRFLTIYAHCADTRVKAGQTVRQGDLIATVGSTGWSTNSHLHYEVRSDLEQPGTFHPIDPRIYILDYQWTDEESLLIRSRTGREYTDFDPLPTALVGRRRSV